MFLEEKGNGKKTNNETKKVIIETSSNLIMEKGIKNTSLADIAQAVGISKGTLYYYYSSKDDIIYDIMEEHLNRTTRELFNLFDNISEDNTLEQILHMVFQKLSWFKKEENCTFI